MISVRFAKHLPPPIDLQIKAEEKRKADEKAAREQAEAAERARVQGRIDAIREYLVRAAGATCQEIADMGRELEALDISLELYGERTGEALQLRNEVMAKLVSMSAAEAERVMRQAELDRQQAELNAQRAAFAAEQEAARKAQAEREAAELAEQKRKDRIQEHISDLLQTYGRTPYGLSSGRVQMLKDDLASLVLTADRFGERLAEAEALKADLLQGLTTAHAVAIENEEKAAKEERERLAREAQQRAAAERLQRIQAHAKEMRDLLQQSYDMVGSTLYLVGRLLML